MFQKITVFRAFYLHLAGFKVRLSSESTHKGSTHNWRSKYVTQVQQQRPESPTVTLTQHACKYKVHPQKWMPSSGIYPTFQAHSATDTGVRRQKTEPVFIQDRT